jgi:hypothetical protein
MVLVGTSIPRPAGPPGRVSSTPGPRDRAVPADLDEIIDLHQRALLEWADRLA